jgi:hypothetical protein
MNSLALNLLIVFGSIAIISFVSLKVFRFYIRLSRMEKVMAEGVVLGETSIEFPRTLFLGIGKIDYQEIESVELVPFPAKLGLRVRYGKAVCSAPGPRWNSFFHETVVVKLKPSHLICYYAFDPSNPMEFYAGLKARLAPFSKFSGDPEAELREPRVNRIS